MSTSLGERLLIPLLLTGIFAFLAFGFMFLVRGGSRRMKVVGVCSIFFILGTIYCMAWHEQLTALTGWDNTWIGLSVIIAASSIALCKFLLSRGVSSEVRGDDE